MSFSFYINAPEPPDYQRVLDGIDLWDVHCDEEEPEDGPWPEGTLHFYRENLSTRGVEISLEEGKFQVRILTLSSPEDYELALRFTESAAEELGQEVEPEGFVAMPAVALRDRFDDNWIRHTNEYGAAIIQQMVKEADSSNLTMDGSKRPIYIGPRVVQELEDDGPEEDFPDRLIEKMREIQNIDEGEYFFANVMEARPTEAGQEDDAKFTFAVFGPEVKYLLPSARFYALIVAEVLLRDG